MLFKHKEVPATADDGDETASRLTELEAENSALKQKIEAHETQARIREYGLRLGVDAESVLSESFDKALLALVDAHLQKEQDLKESFEQSASLPAGVASLDESDESLEPQTFADAITLVAARDKIGKVEAAKVAQKEFKLLFDALYVGVSSTDNEEE